MEKEPDGKRPHAGGGGSPPASVSDGGKFCVSMRARRQAGGTEITSFATNFTFCHFAFITGR